MRRLLSIGLLLATAMCGRSGFYDPAGAEENGSLLGDPSVVASGDGDGPTDDGDTAPTCGFVGLVCCSGDVCDSGSCFNGRCATWGGSYACTETFMSRTCGENPLTGTPTCPAGFTNTTFETYRDQSEGVVVNTTLCERKEASGTLVELFATGGAGCQSTSGACHCPSYAIADTYACQANPFSSVNSLTVCASETRVDGDSFGGSYGASAGGCATPNRYTGDCTCPTGYAGEVMMELECETVTVCDRIP